MPKKRYDEFLSYSLSLQGSKSNLGIKTVPFWCKRGDIELEIGNKGLLWVLISPKP